MPRLVCALLALLAAALLAGPAGAIELPDVLRPVQGNPAERLVGLPPDPIAYDRAVRCRKAPTTGILRFQRWLEANVRGSSWGTMRCEKWGPRSASLHAEGRAIDWHLDAANPADARAARRLIALLLAPDSAGTPAALARRMGVQGIIFDCRAWWAGQPTLGRYSTCFDDRGRRKKGVDRTTAHRDHVHLELSWAGARARTSFWAAAVP